VSPVKYELGVYIPEDDIVHSHSNGKLESYTILALVTDHTTILRHSLNWEGRSTLCCTDGSHLPVRIIRHASVVPVCCHIRLVVSCSLATDFRPTCRTFMSSPNCREVPSTAHTAS
jgi:hypothetical protein